MKKILLVLSFLFVFKPAFAGIPVTVIADIPSQINQMQNWAQMLKEYATMVEQLDQMRNQFTQMEKDYKSVTGSRNLGDILNSPEFRQYLPRDWQNIYSRIRNDGYDGLSGAAKALRDASKIFDTCERFQNATERRICNAQAVKAAQDQAFAQDAYKKAEDRVEQIEELMREINRTTDPKAIAELNARIQAEQALIQNEQTKLAMYEAFAKAEHELLNQQANEIAKKTLANRNFGRYVAPMEFN